VAQRYNCFFRTSAEAKVAKDLFVHAVNFHARKPQQPAGRRSDCGVDERCATIHGRIVARGLEENS
jgi:hypothetical protein